MRLTTFSFRRFGLLSRFQLASTLFLLVFLTVVLQNRNSDNALFDSGHGPPMFYTDTMHTVTDVADQETVDDGRPRRLLTITVDDSSMFLPDVSIFIHIYMPAGIQWRYISYRTQDLASLRLDTDVLMVTASEKLSRDSC
uniref:Uncharacterized protein n=1 Tax=Spongospora subterranea TaxID=70186 RepID=A0A0H5RBF4_9EUKA|eukprot:CRZ11141.1 hypothetical protein [Spongospora subterranea]